MLSSQAHGQLSLAETSHFPHSERLDGSFRRRAQEPSPPGVVLAVAQADGDLVAAAGPFQIIIYAFPMSQNSKELTILAGTHPCLHSSGTPCRL